MAERQAGGAHAPRRVPRHARRTASRLPPDVVLTSLGASRPPCSVAEREIADAVRRRFRAAGLRPIVEPARAPTSPTWAVLLRALFRVWAAAFLAAGWPEPSIGLAAAAVIGGIPAVAGTLRFVPLLGSRTRNVIAVRRGRERELRPLVVVAHLDTHATAGAPLHRVHAFVAACSAWLALVAAVLGRPGASTWRVVAAVVAAESVVTMARLAQRELRTPIDPPDDNTSGVLALIRAAEMLMDDHEQPLRDIWLVGTGGGTSGSYGLTALLRSRRELRRAWVVELDALGTGEVVASPIGARFPHPGTPRALLRAIGNAAALAGDPMTVRRIWRPHSDAKAALRMRTGAIVLTGGLRPAHDDSGTSAGPDLANAERVARLVTHLAHVEP